MCLAQEKNLALAILAQALSKKVCDASLEAFVGDKQGRMSRRLCEGAPMPNTGSDDLNMVIVDLIKTRR